MNPILRSLNEELAQIVVLLRAFGSNEPLNIAHNTWNAPGITRDELVQTVEDLIAWIAKWNDTPLNRDEDLISDYKRRLDHLKTMAVPQIWSGNCGQAVFSLLGTLQMLRAALEKALPADEDLAKSIALATSNAKSTTTRLRALDATISALEPKSISLNDMVLRIESANAAADQLPVDLEALRDARTKIDEILRLVLADHATVGVAVTSTASDKLTLEHRVKEAENIVAQCSAAYAASTSHGLAAAFTERSSALAKSMWVWVAGLVVALGLGSWIGSTQLRSLSEVIKEPSSSTTLAGINLVLALLSVGATVWFSWLSTKQIGQRFRLAEDYAFKASVSRAYEGYRREAANIDESFVARLFSSALSRLDEQPLRLVETTSHGSPWHELASSDVIRKASETVPDFMSTVTQLAKDGLAAVHTKTRAAVVATTSGSVNPPPV